MAAKVQITLDDQVSGPMKAVARSAVDAGGDFDNLQDDLQDVERASGELANSVDNLSDDIRALTASMSKLDQENKQVKNSQDDIKKSSSSLAEKVTAVSTATLAGIEIFKKAMEAGKKAFEIIKAGAEQGNPAAIALVDSIGEVQGALTDIANDPGFQQAGKNLAAFIKDELVPAIKAIPTAWRDAQDWIANAITSTTDFVGLTEGATDELKEMVKQQRASYDAAKAQTVEAEKKFKGDKALTEVNKELAKIEEAKRQNAERETLAKVKSTAELQTRIKTETEALKKLAADGKLTDDERAKRLADIAAQEGRIVELKKEQSDAQKEMMKSLGEMQKTVTDATKSVYQKMTDEAKKNVDAMVAKEKQAVDALAAKLNELKGKDGEAAGVVGKIRDSLDPTAVVKQIADNRAKPMLDQAKQADDEQRKIQHDLNRVRQSRSSLAKGPDDEDSRVEIAKLDEQEAGLESRMKASQKKERGFKQSAASERQIAFNQAKKGALNPDEIADAQDQMTNSVIDQAAASGELSQNQTKALRTAAEAQLELAKNQRQNAADIEAINQALEGVLDGTKKTGQRQRAQRGAAGG
jgi:hypothetical protein